MPLMRLRGPALQEWITHAKEAHVLSEEVTFRIVNRTVICRQPFCEWQGKEPVDISPNEGKVEEN